MTIQISPHEAQVLEQLRANGTLPEVRRAAIILLGADGKPVADIAAAVELSESRVRHYLREWGKVGLDIFGAIDQAPVPPAGKIVAAPEAAKSAGPAPVDEEPADDDGAAEVPGVTVPRLPLVWANTVGIAPDDPMHEAGRKALLFHFERMLFHEPGSRTGEDIESVHDMRVATRRMRSAIRLCGPYFAPGALKRFGRRLRRVAGALGVVRDLDVLIDKAGRFVAAHPEIDLSPLLADWEQARAAGRAELIRVLDGRKYRRFVDEFHAFLTSPGAGSPPAPAAHQPFAYQVRQVVPTLIYEHLERVRAYEPILESAPLPTLHALRIEFKRLRYTLEFFREALGPEAKQVIDRLKAMQDHLGDLNDAVVAEDLLRAFVDTHNEQYSGIPIFLRPDISGVLAYAAAKHHERERLLASFPAAWASFMDESVRRDLALCVAAL